MFYVPRQPNDEKADWVSLIKDRYICRLKEIDGVAPEFLKFVSDKNNIRIKRRSKFVFCDEYDIEMSYRITVSSQSVVSDGYKVETEERWGGDTDVYLREQTRTVTTSTSDNQCYRFSKRFVTKPVSGKNIVIDEYGGMSGIVTINDLLECIVGDIYDDPAVNRLPDIEPLDSKKWLIRGSAPVEDVEKALGVRLEGDFDTFAGYVLTMLSSIPEDGSTLMVENEIMTVRITSVTDHRIEKTMVSLKDIPGETEDD